jgi:hypothetical protein
VHLVTLGTAGLSNDLLHVLNLSLAADEGAELEEELLAFGSEMFGVGLVLVLGDVGHGPWWQMYDQVNGPMQ